MRVGRVHITRGRQVGKFLRNVREVRPSPLVEGWQVGKLG